MYLNMPQTESGTCTVSTFSLPSNQRTSDLLSLFTERFSHRPEFFVRVPGRVNLIGEHVDYCGYGVCPMALEQDMLLAVSSCENSSLLKIANLDAEVYCDYEGDLEKLEIKIDGAPKWYQYALCGIKGILEILPADTPLRGLTIMVHGTVPPSAGLSSSSALVSAAALATAHAHKHRISKEKLANLCAECERYIGTQGGGMDQAIAFLATEGCAKAIDFSPLRCRDVVLPPGAVFVVAHSLAKLNKAATADYNCRVVECRLAAQIIAKKKGLDWINIKRLGELQIALNVDLGTLITIVKEILHEGPYSKDEVLKVLDVSAEELTKTSLTPNTTHIQEFKLRDRALHVFTESLRVEKFIEECKNAPASGDTSLQVLGRLMNESHDSLRDLYECSHPRLDRLVELSRELTFGARLTGAGWGGCAVALVPRANIDKYISTLQEKFYDGTSAEDLSKLVFSTSPNSGACIYYATN